MAITAKVYNDTGLTLIATLSKPSDMKWLDQYNDVGSGSLRIHVDDADLVAHPTITNEYNIIKFLIDGVERFAYIVEPRDNPPAPQDEKAGEFWTLAGRGVLALLEDGRVYPEADPGQGFPDQRYFGYMSGFYDASSWIAATEIQQQNVTSGSVPRFWKYPRAWKDPSAYWIWSEALSNANGGTDSTNSPEGTSYFRQTFHLTDAKRVKVFASALNHFRLWLDDELVIDDLSSDTYSYKDAQTFKRTLGVGYHTIVAQVVKDGYTSGQNNHPAGFICSIHEIEDDALVGVIERTDSSWSCLNYPASVPGMTPGEILRILIDEAKNRGCFTGITRDFDDDLDSNGNAWSTISTQSIPIGNSVLDAVLTLTAEHIDIEMTSGQHLKAYPKGTLGTDLTGTIALTLGAAAEIQELGAQSEPHLANAVLARYATGALVERTDATSLASHKRKEVYLELNTAPTKTQAFKIIDASFQNVASPHVLLTGTVTAGSNPYTDWGKGDTITAPSQTGDADSLVTALGVEQDEAGNPVYHVELTQDA